MKKSFLLVFVSCLSLIACNDGKSGNGIYYNDFETMGYWSDSPKIVRNIGHSGTFSVFTDANNEYTEGFKVRMGDIKISNQHLVTATAWVMANDVNAKSQLVINIDSSGKSIAWVASQTQPVILTPGKWFELKCTLSLPNNLNPDDKLFVFGWYNGSGKVYYDDLLIKVE